MAIWNPRTKKWEDFDDDATDEGVVWNPRTKTWQNEKKAKDDDIAPVKDSDETEKRTWFEKGAFEDGYQFGDIFKTAAGTMRDVEQNLMAGILGIGEAVVDAGAYLVGGAGKLFGADEFADKTKKFIADDLIDEKKAARAILGARNPLYARDPLNLDDSSVLGDKTDSVVQSGGQLIGTLGLQAVGVPWFVTSGVTSFGKETESAFKEGASYREAGISGLITAGAEILTEKIFGGSGLGEKGLINLDGLTKGISRKSVKLLADFGLDVVGEGGEEVASEFLSTLGQQLSYEKEDTWKELLTNEEAMDRYLYQVADSLFGKEAWANYGEAAIGGMLLGGVANTGKVVKSNKAGRDYRTGLTENEQKVFDSVYNKKLAEAENTGKKLSKNDKAKIYDEVMEELQKGKISVEDIEEALGGETYKTYKNTVESEDALLKEFDELGKKTNPTLADQSRYAELKEQVKEIKENSKRDQLKGQLGEEVFGLAKQGNDSYLLESYADKARRGQTFEADVKKYDVKQQETIQKAIDSGILNNTRRTHEFVDMVAKISADKGVSFDFLNNEKLKNSSFAVDGKFVNGYLDKKTNTIGVNINSAKSLNTIVGHEISHVLEGTELYGEMQTALFEYAKSKNDYNSRREALKKLYAEEDIDTELTADLVGDYLFSDPDFVKHLSTNHRNVFQKIYDEIKYLLKVVTAGSKEEKQLLKVKKAFEDAYRSNTNEKAELGDSETKYSLREEAPPKKTGIAYKVFYVKDGKLYPPMVANPNGADTPIGVWLNADVGTSAAPSKTGRLQVKAGGKGTQGGSGSLAFRPGWHLGDIPRASQFDRVNPETGKKELFPKDFVWAECEYAMDVDYQEEAMSYGYTENGKFRHSYAGLPKLPENGYYRYRTNPNPDTVPWVITGAMKVKRILSDAEVNAILEQNGVDPIHRQGGDVELSALGFGENGDIKYSLSENTENSLDKYAKKQYNDFGWARDTEAISKNELDDMYSKIHTKGSLKRFKQSSYGEAIIEVNDSPNTTLGVNNVFVFAKGTKNNPEITRVVRVNFFDEESVDIFRKDIYANTDRRSLEAYARVMGEEFVRYYDRSNSAAYGEYANRTRTQQSGSESEGIAPVNRNGDQRSGAFEQTQSNEIAPINKASSSDGVFFDGENLKYSLSADTNGKQLSEGQKEYFKDSKVVDENGNLKVMYHGTSKGGYTVFDTYGSNYGLFGQGSYFTDNKSVAESYTKKGKGNNPQVYESYLNITNPMDMDAEADADAWRKAFPDATFPESGTNEDFYRAVEDYFEDGGYYKYEAAEELVSTLESMGYDGITHIGGGRRNNTNDTSHRVYIAFNPEQIKNTDNTNPTENPDIRYSLSQDSEGAKLTKEQSEYFKDTKALDSNGNLLKVYHTTNNDFTVFDKSKMGEATGDTNTYLGFFFADDAEYMQNFPEFENGKTEAYYLNMKNPIDMTNISKEAFLDVVEVLGGDVTEAAEIYDQELSDEMDRAQLRGDNNTSLQLIRLLDEMTGDADYRAFIEELKPHYNELMSKGYDGVVNYLDELWGAKEYIVLDSNQAKLTSNTKPTADADIRYSLSDSKQGDNDVKVMDGGSVTKYSLSTWTPETQTKVRENLIKSGYDADKVDKWIKDTNSVASVIAADKDRLDFVAADNQVMLKDNQEYIKTLDASTLCAKRLVYQGTFDAIQHRMPNTALSSDDLIDLLNMMKEHGVQTPCGVCYVESRRRHLGKFAQGWLDSYEGEYKPNLDEVTTSDGLEALRKSHPQTYKDFVDAMNKKGSSNPKVVQLRTEYRNEIMSLTPKQIRDIESIGGLRVQSFSDFETPHMLDMMQAVMDMSAKGLHSQAYTKVPNFAWVFGDTGIKINLSLIAEGDGFDADGNLAFSSTEGMDINEAMKLRDAYSQNVGTIIVGANDKHILAAMADDRIDFIIPFHRSGWGMKELEMMGMSSYTDYTYGQKEHDLATGKGVENLYPIDYWDYTLTGKENAERYLNLCAKTGREPKFSKFLVNNGDGSYSLQPDGSTDGYWKTLIDFKMYDNEGNGASQQKVQPNFNMDEAYRVLAEYEGGANKLPVANDVVEEFVAKYQSKGLAPTMSLTAEGETPKSYGRFNIYGKDVMLEQEDIAPINATTTEDIAPMPDTAEEEAPKIEKQTTAQKIRTTRAELHQNKVDGIKAKFAEKGLDLDEALKKAKDLSTFSTVDNTPQRVMEKSLGYKEGQILADETVNKVAQNETEGVKWLNSFTDRKSGLLAKISKQYNIKPGSKESAAAQMYAEGFYVDENNNLIKYGDAELAKDFPDTKVRENIKGLAGDSRIRQIYDDTLKAINESRARNAYPEIPRLDNYFLHFRAMDDTFSRLGLPFNPNDIRAKDLPTDLNGVTADLKPGQPYFASAMHRRGQRTSFDLLGGLEKYLSSAKNQIYHIDDIQTFRALRNYIADTYGQANGLEGLDALTEEEAQERIKDVYNSHLSTFAKFLNEEANVLAGKTALIDRGIEGMIGRRAMTFMDTLNRQVGSNMVGYNVSSALTNLIAPVQAFAKMNKFAFVKGFAQTVSNRIKSINGKSDGFTEASPVVIRRKGADRFYRTAWQKISDPGYALMGAVDNFSTELIARAKYNELTAKGMDSEKAHIETDKWVSRLMGDRSLGQMPQLYNSKALGLITKFQLEVRNQLDSQFYDTIKEAEVSTEDIQNGRERNAKKAAKIASTFATLAISQHLFGKVFESIAGYNPAFDIIGVLIKALGLDDDEESEDTVLDNIEQGFMELMGDLPYTSILEGGRIPIASALPIEELYKGVDQYGNEKSRLETIKEALPYYIMPGGYGQAKKTIQGLSMFDEDHPIAGSYTDSGNLRFPVEDTLGNRIQAGIFGQWASDNARDYFDNEYAPLKEKQIQEFVDLDIPIGEYRKIREDLADLDTLGEKAVYIAGLDLPMEKKNLLINNIADREEPIDLTGLVEYGDFGEFEYAKKYPDKYKFLAANNISYEDYQSFDEDTKEAWSWAYQNPEKFTLSKAVASDLVVYKQYTKALSNIKADKDEDGDSISGSRKKKVIEYINGLDADYGEKIILFKSEYNADDTYNRDIIDYLNNRDDLSYEDVETILKELGFDVDSEGNISW